MTTPLSYPLTAGTRHSFVSIEIKIAGIIIPVKSINYSRKRSRGVVRGNHPDPIAKTRGNNEYAADGELYTAEWMLLKQTLKEFGAQQNPPVAYGDVLFPVYVSWSENGFETFTDEIQGCTMDSTESSNSQGEDASVRKIDLSPLKVLFADDDDVTVPLARAFSTAA